MRIRIFKAMLIRAERRHADMEIVVGTPTFNGGTNAGVPAGTTGDKKTPCHKTPPMLTGDGENTWDAARLPGAGMALVGESGCWWACGARRHNKMDNPTVALTAGSVPAAMLLQRLRAAGAVKKGGGSVA